VLVFTHHHRNRLSNDDTCAHRRGEHKQSREEEDIDRQVGMEQMLANDRMLLGRPWKLDPEERQDQKPSPMLIQSHQSQDELAAKGDCDGNDSPRHASERYNSN
jgi:hypothetical protein